MPTLKPSFFLLLLGVILTLTRGHAFGKIVYDPTNFAQAVKIFKQTEQQVSQLQRLSGLSEQQLTALKSIQDYIGKTEYRGQLTPDSVVSNFRQLGVQFGMGAKQLEATYTKTGPFQGALDVFMGASFNDFKTATLDPMKMLSEGFTARALESVGVQAGVAGKDIRFAQRVSGMTEEERRKNRENIALGMADLAVEKYWSSADKRRLAVQAEANIAADVANRVKEEEEQSLNVIAQRNAETTAQQARLQVLQAQQANEANETLIIKADSAANSLSNMDRRRAEEAEAERIRAMLQSTAR